MDIGTHRQRNDLQNELTRLYDDLRQFGLFCLLNLTGARADAVAKELGGVPYFQPGIYVKMKQDAHAMIVKDNHGYYYAFINVGNYLHTFVVYTCLYSLTRGIAEYLKKFSIRGEEDLISYFIHDHAPFRRLIALVQVYREEMIPISERRYLAPLGKSMLGDPLLLYLGL